MNNLCSFIEMFQKSIVTTDGPIQIKKVTIPMIQRDYAQGRRNNNDIKRVRSRFLDSIYNAFTKKPIVLDFIYGNIDKDGIMIPLDGQQRLTTLFLLHWYAAKKENIEYNKWFFLENFSYETRYSSRDFCNDLIQFKPTFNKNTISEEIINQAWFPLDWLKDPTIDSMINMLDEIHIKFQNIDIWNKLESGSIKFYILPIKDMGLTDEIYIKMNSRGKQLTNFENFKAELEQSLKIIHETKYLDILNKIDKDWTDVLWR